MGLAIETEMKENKQKKRKKSNSGQCKFEEKKELYDSAQLGDMKQLLVNSGVLGWPSLH